MHIVIQDAVSTGASSTSDGVDISDCDIWAVQWVWTGTTNGALKVQGSVDGETYFDISSATATPSGSASSSMFNAAGLVGYNWVRSVYTRTNGTGTLTTKFSGKERSA